MFYVLQYPSFTSFNYAMDLINRDDLISQSEVFNWMVYGKIGESITLTPTYSQVYQQADSKNRYLYEVTVNPIPADAMTAKLAVGATMTITNKEIRTATTSNASYATATVADGVLTITGVAAGTATITVKNEAADTMYTIVVTVA